MTTTVNALADPYAGWNPHVTHAPDMLCIKERGDRVSGDWSEVTCPSCVKSMPVSLRPKKTETNLTHVGGVPYSHAPVPRRWHSCKAHTSGTVTRPDEPTHAVEMCACGGLRVDGGKWDGRNSR